MPSTVKVIAKDESYIVRLIEHGMIYEREFTDEKHARSWAAGQQFRLLHSEDTVTDDLVKAYSAH